MTLSLPNKRLLSSGHTQTLQCSLGLGAQKVLALGSVYVLFMCCKCSSQLGLGREIKREREVGKGGGPLLMQGGNAADEMPGGEREDGIVKTSGVGVVREPGSCKNEGSEEGMFPCVQGIARRPAGPKCSGQRGAGPEGRGQRAGQGLSLRPSQAVIGMSPLGVWAEELNHLTLPLNKPLPWPQRMDSTEAGRRAGGPRGGTAVTQVGDGGGLDQGGCWGPGEGQTNSGRGNQGTPQQTGV